MYNLEKFLSSVWLKSFSVNFHFCLEILENFHFWYRNIREFSFWYRNIREFSFWYGNIGVALGVILSAGRGLRQVESARTVLYVGATNAKWRSLLAQVVIDNLEVCNKLAGRVQQAGGS